MEEKKEVPSASQILNSLSQDTIDSAKSEEESAFFTSLLETPPDLRQMEDMMEQVRFYAQEITIERAELGEEDAQAVRLFVAERAAARQHVRDIATVLHLCLCKIIPVSDESFAILLADYENALDSERTRSRAAVEALETALDWKSKPRLKASLLCTGLIGDALHLLNVTIYLPGVQTSEIACQWNESKCLPPEFSYLLDHTE